MGLASALLSILLAAATVSGAAVLSAAPRRIPISLGSSFDSPFQPRDEYLSILLLALRRRYSLPFRFVERQGIGTSQPDQDSRRRQRPGCRPHNFVLVRRAFSLLVWPARFAR